MTRSFCGKLSVILLSLFLLMGLLFISLTLVSKRMYFLEASQKLNGSPESDRYVVLDGAVDEPMAGMVGRSRILQISISVAVAGLVLVSFFGLYLFNSLTRRLREVTDSVESFREDGLIRTPELKHDPESEDGDEIDRLSAVFSRMAERINDQMAELKNADALRSELITNISHDLRTPLTSLQGYLETMLLKEDLTEDQRREYLKIALKHSDRLRKLISDLFELSRLDAREVQMSPEEFSLCELTQDILQKFSLSAQEKGILLISDFGQKLPFVFADIGLVERALENLIQNALQYTPAGGSVTVSIEPTAGRLVIKVADTGRGIDEENLPDIFDRYYRVDGGERDTQAGAGLGLAITKRIVELHRESLEVASTVGEGTEFYFGLPVSSPESHECRVSD